MRYKILALTLALSIMTWAQTSSQPVNPDHPQSAAPVEKARCGCCDKMASAQTNDAHASCTQAGAKTKNAQEMGSCCSGNETANCCCSDKDAGSCVRADKGQNAAACSGNKCGKEKTASMCCGTGCKDHEKGCCAKQEERTAENFERMSRA